MIGGKNTCIPFDNVYVGLDEDGFCLKLEEPKAVRYIFFLNQFTKFSYLGINLINK